MYVERHVGASGGFWVRTIWNLCFRISVSRRSHTLRSRLKAMGGQRDATQRAKQAKKKSGETPRSHDPDSIISAWMKEESYCESQLGAIPAGAEAFWNRTMAPTGGPQKGSIY